MSAVKLVNISKQFDESGFAVRGVNIQIKDGELAILVGPSGCGKSTILRMIAGLEEQTGGDVFIGDTCVNNLPPRRRDIAMVFQDYALYPHMSVYENLAFGLKLRHLQRDEIEQRVAEAAAILGIGNLLKRKPSALSGGQRQRVALGRALVRQPQVFLFDEPLSNLDAKLRAQMRTEISRLHNQLGATMIYVTHDQVEAMTMGDRIIVINAGTVQQVDTPLAVYNKPANLFTAGFIGSPSMNFLKGRMAAGSFISDSFEIPFRQLKGETRPEVTLGIRPEQLHLNRPDNALALSAELDVVEQLGSESLLYFNLEHRQWIARVPAGENYRPGQKLEFYLNPADLQLFADAERDYRSIIVETD